jgi:lipopolysaccharide/colanic/teichoic acid biosynthesis glycosyltransferase
MKKRERTLLVSSLILLDAVLVVFALVLAYYLRFGLEQPHKFDAYMRMTALAVPVFLAIFAYSRLYDPHLLFGGPQEYANVVKACTFGVIALTMLSFWERGGLMSRAWLLMAWILSFLLVGIGRFSFRRLIFYLRRHGLFITRALVVGANEQAKTIVRQLHGAKERGVRVVGFLDDYLPPGTPVMDGLEVLGSPTELDRLTKELAVGGAVVMPDALAWESFQEIIREAASRRNGLEIKLSPSFYEILTTGVKVDPTTYVPLLTVQRVRITGLDAVLKNLLDYGLGAVLLLLVSPLIAIILLLLWLRSRSPSPDSAGRRPILDRYRVLGLGGREFYTLKFHTGLLGSTRRSLVDPLPAELPDRGNATQLGEFLFRTGLDKLPQLLNVLRGQMSLVGPRTISGGDRRKYGPWLFSMLTVKPGMTGPWAVRSNPTLADEIRLTLYYIRNWTIWVDLQILFRTAARVLQWQGRTEPAVNDAGIASTGGRDGAVGSEEEQFFFSLAETLAGLVPEGNAFSGQQESALAEGEEQSTAYGKVGMTRE